MSFVPCEKTSQKRRVTLENIFQDRLPSLGIREMFAPEGWNKNPVRPYIKCCRSLAIARQQEGTITILSPGAKEELLALTDPQRQEYFAGLILCKTVLLIFSQSRTLPVPLKKQLKHCHLPAAISSFHENLLDSRLKAIIREKIKHCVSVHGVVLEIQGRGILITGQSGIGKTTAALQAMPEGYVWIADDLAVIKKNQSGRLMISGHRKIKEYFHTGETGIMAVDRVLNASQIKSKTALTAIIDVVRTDAGDVSSRIIEKDVLETRLPCLQIGIPRTGYLDKKLLKVAVQQLQEVG
jgi:serine kinase of HPr protein (carbohydrate metabolism regulator)